MFVSKDICFSCLSESGKNNLRTLFHKKTEEEIFANIKFVLPELAILDSENPVCICPTCCTTFRTFYTFKKKCLENFNEWKHFTQKLQGTSNIQHLKNDENEDTWLSSEEQDECKIVGEDKIVVKEELLTSEDNAEQELYQHFVKCETVSYDEQNGDSSVTSEDNNGMVKNKTNSNTDTHSQELRCIMCNEMFLDKSAFDIHLRNHIKNIKGLECLICNRKSGSRSNLIRHMKSHLGIKDLECEICKKKFILSSNLKRHMKIHKGIKDHVCSICKKKFIQSISLKVHMKMHEGIKDYECSVCKKKFIQSCDLKRHMKIHLGIKDYECSICKKKFTRNSNLRKHIKIHESVKRRFGEKNESEDTWLSSEEQNECKNVGEGKIIVKEELLTSEDSADREIYQQVVKNESVSDDEQDGSSNDTSEDINALVKREANSNTDTYSQEFQCSLCTEVFTDRIAFNAHWRIHVQNITGFECLICNKNCGKKSYLIRHMKSHSDIKVWECSICKKKFILDRSLKRHMKSHLVTRYIECSICKKKFTQHNNLHRHMKTHKGIKDHECSICKKKFTQSTSLKIHMKIHEDIRDYECSICKKKFIQRCDLNRHMKIHLDKKGYECSICKMKCTQESNLTSHMKTHGVINKKL